MICTTSDSDKTRKHSDTDGLPKETEARNFSDRMLFWYDQAGRKFLPWQQNITPYKVWVSEIMLQQTQVVTVIPYFERFMESFSEVDSLAQTSLDEVMAHWSGLGYYSRARNLYKTADIITHIYAGKFPENLKKLMALPGIGRSTAGAIASIAMNIRAPILDGNVKRVLTRYFAISGWYGKSSVEKTLWNYAELLLPQQRFGHYNQSLMDLGAIICKRTTPKCCDCPLQTGCIAKNNNQQSLYPSSKPKKTLPVKTTKMLILFNKNGEVLLKKRPAKGVWGSLWSLPEYNDKQSLKQTIEPLTINIQLSGEQPVYRHTFSHYHLDIIPVYAKTTDKNSVPDDQISFWRWLGVKQVTSVGLPAPVKKLIVFRKNNDTEP